MNPTLQTAETATSPVFRMIFIGIVAAVLLLRVVYHVQARTHRRSYFNVRREGTAWAVLRNLLGIPLLVCLAAYVFAPGVLAWARVPLPAWAQWIGVVLGLVSLALMGWTHSALGRNFSGTLHIREDHALVTDGPYRWVRHPMYTAILIQFVAFFLLSANWLIGTLGIATIAIVMIGRTGREEAMMIEAFQDDYRAYMSHTNRFFPGWRRRKA